MPIELDAADAAWLEALLDPRLGLDRSSVDPARLAAIEAAGLLEAAARERVLEELDRLARLRPVEWADRTTTQGAVLDAFAAHCSDELDDVEVVEHDGATLVLRWRSETSRIEARNGTVGVARLAGAGPTLLLADLEGADPALLEAYLTDAALRSSVLVLDLGRLEKLGAVRSSVFVYLEWFLRDAYGVKVLPSATFTQGLLARGIISLGMG